MSRLELMADGSMTYNHVVVCRDCGANERWNKAVADGWCSDVDGKAYEDYYCPACAGKAVHGTRDCKDE